MIKIKQVTELGSWQQPTAGFTQAELDKAIRVKKKVSMSPNSEEELKEFYTTPEAEVFVKLNEHNSKVEVVRLFFTNDGLDLDEFYNYMDGKVYDEADNLIVHGDEVYDFMINEGGMEIITAKLKGCE